MRKNSKLKDILKKIGCVTSVISIILMLLPFFCIILQSNTAFNNDILFLKLFAIGFITLIISVIVTAKCES